MTRDERLARIKAADDARLAATEAARKVSPRNLNHPLRVAQRKAILALADELVAGMEARGASYVSLRSAATHLGVSVSMLGQRVEAARRIRNDERPWWPRKSKAKVA